MGSMAVTMESHASRDAAPLRADASVRTIRRACVRALWQELATYPKPGLVSLEDNGSHRDMDAGHFWRSLWSLRGYFGAVALAGAQGVEFAGLRELALHAELRMMSATRGVNTHRGAIFNLGLLAAAAAYRGAHNDCDANLGSVVQQVWGPALAGHQRNPDSHGARVARAHGPGGALAQALGGFPSAYQVGLPAYREALARTGNPAEARVQAFFALMARVDDTNLLHRGGAAGLSFAQHAACGFLEEGGVYARGWWGRAHAVHRAFVARNLSPGGSADLLATCLFVHAMELDYS